MFNPYQFNGGYPSQYPTYSQPMQSAYQVQPQSQTQNGIIYVNGDEGAKAYAVPQGGSIFLMDCDSPRFFIKSANAQGHMSIRTFKFEEITNGESEKKTEEKPVDFATKDDLKKTEDKLIRKLNELAKTLKGGDDK